MPFDGFGGTNGGLLPFVTIPGTTSTAVPARNRSIRNGIVLPPWDKMNLMSGNSSVVPLQIRLPIVLVVSVAYSIIYSGISGTRSQQQAGVRSVDRRVGKVSVGMC